MKSSNRVCLIISQFDAPFLVKCAKGVCALPSALVVGKHIVSEEALTSGNEEIGVDESTPIWHYR